MEYRSLSRTGIKVSKLCLGCLTFGASIEPEDSYDMVDRAIDAVIPSGRMVSPFYRDEGCGSHIYRW